MQDDTASEEDEGEQAEDRTCEEMIVSGVSSLKMEARLIVYDGDCSHVRRRIY